MKPRTHRDTRRKAIELSDPNPKYRSRANRASYVSDHWELTRISINLIVNLKNKTDNSIAMKFKKLKNIIFKI